MGAACAGSDRYQPDTYVVQPRDTLYGIAWRCDLDYRALARWNNIGPDFRVTIGQVLRLRPASPARAAAAAPAGAAPRSLRAQPPQAPRASAECPHWLWPTDHKTPPKPAASGGILMSGDLGQGVHAACAGRVVYVGNGLRSFGNLVIIKHGETLLSAYAHNEELLVREGQDVQAGQDIARMGLGPHQIPALYFEIRVNGKPVDPLSLLSGVE